MKASRRIIAACAVFALITISLLPPSLHADPGPPYLEITATNGTVTLSWTTQMTFTLLAANHLETNTSWTVVTNTASATITPLGNLYRVTLVNPSTPKFFVLRR